MKRFRQESRALCTLIALLFAISTARAQSDNRPVRDSIAISTSMYFKFDVSSKIDSLDYGEMYSLLLWIKDNDDARVDICGWTDPVGTSEYNKKLSQRRAETAKEFLIEKGVQAEKIKYAGMGIDHHTPNHTIARRSTIMAIKEVEPKREPKPQPRPKPEPAREEAEAVEEVVEEAAAEEPKESGHFAVRTNLLYWVGASINAGAEWNPAGTSLGVVLNGGYGPVGGDHKEYSHGGWFVSPEIRYYLGESKQWFVGAEFLAGGYNFKMSDTGYQGDVISGGILGGYKIELNDTFDMDFTLGVGYGTLEYDTYYHHESGINVRTAEGVSKSCIMPIQAGVNLIWKIR